MSPEKLTELVFETVLSETVFGPFPTCPKGPAVLKILRRINSLYIYISLRWIQEGFKGGFLQKHLNPIRGPFLGDSVQILGCISVFWSVTPTFGLYL